MKGIFGALDVGPDRVSVGLPISRFSTITVDGWDIGPETATGGTLRVERWSDEKIAAYAISLDRYELLGRPAAIVARKAGRQIKGGVVGRLLGALEAPVHKPEDRDLRVENVSIRTMPRNWAGVLLRPE